MSPNHLEVLAPRPLADRAPKGPLTVSASELPDREFHTDWLRGKKIAIRVEWPSFKAFTEEIEAILREEYGIADVALWDLEAAETSPYLEGGRANEARIGSILDELADGSDCGIFGLAN